MRAGALLLLACAWGQPAHAGRAAGASALIIGKLPVGTRAIALAGAYTAIAGEPSAVEWNPAGLAKVERPRFEALHVEQGEQIRMENLLVALPQMFGGTVGISASFLNQPPLTTALENAAGDFAGTGGTFDAWEYKAVAGYGQALSRLGSVSILGSLWSRGSAGAAVSLLGQRIGTSSDVAASVDAGYLYEDDNEGRSVGVVIRQIGAPVDSRPLPVTGQAGVGQLIGDVLVSADVLTATDDALRVRAGVEWTYATEGGGVTLRAGAQHSLSSALISRLAAGLAYRFQLAGDLDFTVEYAYAPVAGFEDLHAVSVRVGL